MKEMKSPRLYHQQKKRESKPSFDFSILFYQTNKEEDEKFSIIIIIIIKGKQVVFVCLRGREEWGDDGSRILNTCSIQRECRLQSSFPSPSQSRI